MIGAQIKGTWLEAAGLGCSFTNNLMASANG